MDILDFLYNINFSIDWAKPSWDLFIVLFFIVSAFLYGLSLGRDRIIVILVSIYVGLAIVSTAPYISNLPENINVTFGQLFAFKVTGFLAVFIALFFLLSRSALSKTIGSRSSRGNWWQVIVFSFLHVGLLISIVLSFLPPDTLEHLAPITKQIFVSEIGQFTWIIVPVIAMVFVPGEN